jgi:energy-coupling factor transporter ATP-binding protein EcfA2
MSIADDFLHQVSTRMQDDEPPAPATTTITMTLTQESCTFLQTTLLDLDTDPTIIRRYFDIFQSICLRPVTLDVMTWLIPVTNLEAVVDRLAIGAAFLEMLADSGDNVEEVLGMSQADAQEATTRISQRCTDLTNIARLWVAFVSNETAPTIIPHPAVGTVLQETIQKPHQKLLEFVLQRAGDARLRRTGTALFRPHRMSCGTLTYFYEYHMECREYVMACVTPMQRYAEQYSALTLQPSTIHFVTNFLAELPDQRVPKLVVNRTRFSYRNGIFDATTGQITPYNRVVNTDVTANFFDYELPVEYLECTPERIPTPHFDKILHDQQYDTHSKFWMYTMCGRAFHSIGSLDDWQICMFIRGVAGSGKSTILKVMALMYQDNHIGRLMSDGQTTFADEHLFDKFMVLAMDLDKEVQISTTRMNSMISGEGLSVNRKHKIALNCQWSAPLLMASNSQPPFRDVAGNIVRRFMIFLFDHAVMESDPHLFTKLLSELPLLCVKMARSYLSAVQSYGSRSLWEPGILPPMIHRSRREYLVMTNPMSAFLESDWVRYGPELQTTSSEFRKNLVQYGREHGERKTPPIALLTKVDHGHLFAMYGCTLEVDPTTRQVVIQGMGVHPPE